MKEKDSISFEHMKMKHFQRFIIFNSFCSLNISNNSQYSQIEELALQMEDKIVVTRSSKQEVVIICIFWLLENGGI